MKHWVLAAALVAVPAGAVFADGADAIKPVNITAVNTGADEDEPCSTVNSLGTGQLFFVRGGEVFAATRSGKSFLTPKAFADFQERGEYRGVFVGFPKKQTYPQHLYYATNADSSKRDGRGDNFDIYLMIREGSTGGFRLPIPLHAISTAEDEMHPCLAADGRLFFSRKTKDGWRVLVAKRPKPELNFDKPDIVDLPAGFHHPALNADASIMYLQGKLMNGRWGLFRSTFQDGTWSPPVELAELNHAEGNVGSRSPSLSRDGSTLYFASDRPGGKGGLDIWSAPVSQLKKP